MIPIRNTKRVFIVTCIIWAVFVSVVFAVKARPAEGEEKPDSKIEAEIVYVTEYRESNAYYSSISVSHDDIELLARLVYLEACNQPEVGERGIVEVVLNRVLDSRFPDTIYDVIYQKKPTLQFSTSPYISDTTPAQEQYDVVNMVLNETSPVLDTSTVYFSTFPQTENVTAVINDHYFCS